MMNTVQKMASFQIGLSHKKWIADQFFKIPQKNSQSTLTSFPKAAGHENITAPI